MMYLSVEWENKGCMGQREGQAVYKWDVEKLFWECTCSYTTSTECDAWAGLGLKWFGGLKEWGVSRAVVI